MLVYICGPMSGLPENNYPAFFEAEEKLKAAGYEVLNPARNPAPDPPTWENYMKLSVPQVCRADMVVLLPDWFDSQGAKLERHVAEVLGIHIRSLVRVLYA